MKQLATIWSSGLDLLAQMHLLPAEIRITRLGAMYEARAKAIDDEWRASFSSHLDGRAAALAAREAADKLTALAMKAGRLAREAEARLGDDSPAAEAAWDVAEGLRGFIEDPEIDALAIVLYR